MFIYLIILNLCDLKIKNMENMEESSEDILEYLSKLDKLFSNRCQLYDHLYSGDKDTLIEAYNLIVNTKHHLGDYYDHSIEQRQININIYRNEINVAFDELVSFGKEIIKRINVIRIRIKDIQEFELDYMEFDQKREYLIKKILGE